MTPDQDVIFPHFFYFTGDFSLLQLQERFVAVYVVNLGCVVCDTHYNKW